MPVYQHLHTFFTSNRVQRVVFNLLYHEKSYNRFWFADTSTNDMSPAGLEPVRIKVWIFHRFHKTHHGFVKQFKEHFCPHKDLKLELLYLQPVQAPYEARDIFLPSHRRFSPHSRHVFRSVLGISLGWRFQRTGRALVCPSVKTPLAANKHVYINIVDK